LLLKIRTQSLMIMKPKIGKMDHGLKVQLHGALTVLLTVVGWMHVELVSPVPSGPMTVMTEMSVSKTKCAVSEASGAKKEEDQVTMCSLSVATTPKLPQKTKISMVWLI